MVAASWGQMRPRHPEARLGVTRLTGLPIPFGPAEAAVIVDSAVTG